MNKKSRGYFTIEASVILPIVLFLYFLIIVAALFLYCRCAISQDNFLLGMRAGRFSFGVENYGEVIYGCKQEKTWQAEHYVQERLTYKKAFYPLFPSVNGEYRLGKESVLVQTGQRGSSKKIVKNVESLNPIKIIREERKNKNA